MASQQLLGILQIQVSGGGWDELPLYRPTVSLGRSTANQVILQDPKVSSQHAELSLGREGWLVSDQNSSNGTFLDGQRLPPGTHVLPPAWADRQDRRVRPEHPSAPSQRNTTSQPGGPGKHPAETTAGSGGVPQREGAKIPA